MGGQAGRAFEKSACDQRNLIPVFSLQFRIVFQRVLRWVDLAGWFCPPGDKLGGRKHLLAQTTFRWQSLSTKEATGIQWNSVTRQFRLLNPISNDIYNLRSAIIFFSKIHPASRSP